MRNTVGYCQNKNFKSETPVKQIKNSKKHKITGNYFKREGKIQ